MDTKVRLGPLPLCAICRDQVDDFVWVSLVLTTGLLMGALSGISFMVEEVLVFFVLIFLKHRFRPPLDRFLREA